ncbi:hypothetical protein [uncultured Megasphaera sp.]|uniref:hypothetical protein n=1 Tax=uncultured Megasphaera sp. TaxID=165188 RepID=UPI0011AEE64E|nr:hypothetical protein [uncultured Megasphaera sp.]
MPQLLFSCTSVAQAAAPKSRRLKAVGLASSTVNMTPPKQRNHTPTPLSKKNNTANTGVKQLLHVRAVSGGFSLLLSSSV